jgi:hypothetical protein
MRFPAQVASRASRLVEEDCTSSYAPGGVKLGEFTSAAKSCLTAPVWHRPGTAEAGALFAIDHASVTDASKD